MSIKSRRDFLLFRTESPDAVVEVRCQQLFMQCLEAERTTGQEDQNGSEAWEPWQGEPPARFEARHPDDVLARLELGLATERRIRIVESHWMLNSQFRVAFERILDAVRARGGQIEFVGSKRGNG